MTFETETPEEAAVEYAYLAFKEGWWGNIAAPDGSLEVKVDDDGYEMDFTIRSQDHYGESVTFDAEETE